MTATVQVPVAPDCWLRMYLTRRLSEAEFEHMLALLEALRPGLVMESDE